MPDFFDELSRFNVDFKPEPGRGLPLSSLPDADYDFEIVDVHPGYTPKQNQPVLRWGLRVLSGSLAQTVVENLTFMSRQEAIDRLGTDLATLGFDVEQWKAPARPFSVELKQAIPQLKGKRFRGTVKTNGEYHNLYINAPLLSNGSAPPPSTPAPAVFAPGEEVPF